MGVATLGDEVFPDGEVGGGVNLVEQNYRSLVRDRLEDQRREW
jgi:hypothetical protein